MDVAITELEKIDADRVDGVGMPANGIPILMMKMTAPIVKGQRDCPKCGNSHDADHKGGNCENCGADLPEGDASKAADDQVDCPTCKGDGKMRGNSTDCPDCGATGKVTPAKARQLTAKALVRSIITKAVGADGQVDEQPDIKGGTEVIGQIADLIIAEAQELKAGQAGEIDDILQLAYAAQSVWCWRTGEQAVGDGSVMPATALMQSAAKAQLGAEGARNWTTEQVEEWLDAFLKANPEARLLPPGVAKADLSTKDLNDLPDSAFAYIEPGGSKDSEGKTTPRSKRHFAIHDKAHADNAAARIAQGAKFGDQAKAKVEAAQKKFGEGTSKSVIAPEGTNVDTVVQGNDGQIAKAVADAIAKATAPLEKLRTELEATLAKVKATPVPGGPVLSRNVQVKAPGGVVNDDVAAKAALMRQKAADATAPSDREGYLAYARELEEQATKS